MDWKAWLRANRHRIAVLGAALVFTLLGLYHVTLAAGVLLIGIGAAFVVLALYGDRISEVSAGGMAIKLAAKEASEAARNIASGKVHQLEATITGEGGLAVEPPTITNTGRVSEPTVEHGSFTADAVLAARATDAAAAIAAASTRHELYGRVLDFMRLAGQPDRSSVLEYLVRLSEPERNELLATLKVLTGRKSSDD